MAKQDTVSEGAMLEMTRAANVSQTETRHGRPNGDAGRLHEGKFIVDWFRRDEVHLVDADWDDEKNVTFRSSKHGHIMLVEDLARLVAKGKMVPVGSEFDKLDG